MWRFYPRNPVSQTDVNALIQQMMDAVRTEFDTVKSAPAIVWDARANYGGITPVGLAITDGMPSARATQLSYCTARIGGTDPPEFDTQRYAEYQITPGGVFAYTGKVAVIIDGLDYSAADYFALAIRSATDTKLVGSPTAGAYGGSGIFARSVRDKYAGLELADSFILDPHKWLFTPFDCCALIYRDPELARATHTQDASYLDVIHTSDGEWNPTDYAYHLTRRARGLPLWFSLAVHGVEAYRGLIEEQD